MSLDQFALRIREVLRYRAFKVVYVTGGPRASWADFISTVDHLWPEAEVVSLVTPEVERLAVQQRCLAPSCGTCENLRSLARHRAK